MSASSRTWRGGRFELQLDDHAPEREDRAPGAGRVDDLRRPRSGGDDDRPGRDDAIRGVDADRPRRPRARPAPWTPSRIVAPRRCASAANARLADAGRDREPDVEAHGRETVGEAGLEAPQVVRVRRTSASKSGLADADRGGLRPERVLVPPTVRIPAGSVVEPEVAARRVHRQLRGDLVGERPVARERLAIQGAEHGVGRVPDHARVAARGAGRDRPALVERRPGRRGPPARPRAPSRRSRRR